MDPELSAAPQIMRAQAWEDYALLDSGGGRKLERYGPYRVVRPEPQCFWPARDSSHWSDPDAVFDPTDEDDDGRWRFAGASLQPFALRWRSVRFWGRFTAFRHLAFFPEQAANWEWLERAVRPLERPRVLNLFGYTGVASLVCAAAGAEVTHVDASKKAIGWARENAILSGLEDKPIRWICEDARRYVAREIKRGSLYDGIILDPPKYGRGPEGEVWRVFEDLADLTAQCARLLKPSARFLILNAYAARISGLSLGHLMQDMMTGRGGGVDWGELSLAEAGPAGRAVGLSFFARWEGP